jgi:hypothetical protein
VGYFVTKNDEVSAGMNTYIKHRRGFDGLEYMELVTPSQLRLALKVYSSLLGHWWVEGIATKGTGLAGNNPSETDNIVWVLGE